MERRLLLAIVLSFIVVFASNYFMTKNMPKRDMTKESTVVAEKEPEAAKPPGDHVTTTTTTPAAQETVKEKGSALPAKEDLTDITVKTKLFTAVFTNYGARLKSFKLNDYKIDQSPDSDTIDVVTVSELVHLPLDIHFFTIENVKSLTGGELYNFSTDNLDIVKDPLNNKLVFSYLTKDGLEVKKIYTFSDEEYNVDVDVMIKNTTQGVITGKMNINWVELFLKQKKDRTSVLEAFAFYKKEVNRTTSEDLEKEDMILTGDVKWSGLLKKFFMVAFVPEVFEDSSFYANKFDENLFHIRATTGGIVINNGETKNIKFRVYLGPKKTENLRKYGVGLQSSINYGFFSIIAIPLMELLKFFYRFTHNYGLAIIILTIIIKVLFYPLTQKSYKAMKDMQKISPLLTELKEKYKDDKERLNREVLALYKKHRVNPVGGCFPILLQMPVFFALYQILLNSVELRHAPFYFWITDLSSKDPYYITPIIMGVTMLIQQKMSPSAGDKTQQKMMLIMPIVFTFMFANFAAGLVIYWLVNNVLSIIQQGMVLKKD
jgi:YidC/Oxa1 family membrane protein insertase